MSPRTIYVLLTSILGFVLGIPLNASIVIVNLQSIRKKGKLSPCDVILLAKGIVNIIYQGFLSLQGMLLALSLAVFYIAEVYSSFYASVFFLLYFNFWLTVWLSAHYCTSITNIRYGFFIWLKRIVSNFLSQVLVLTALGLFAVSVPYIWTMNTDSDIKSSENSSVKTFDTSPLYHVQFFYLVPVTFLGCILPFCLTLLCLLLTFSFLVRHVWRVKNNDSGSSRPNLQAHVTALRTIFFLLLMFTSVFMSRVMFFIGNPTTNEDPITVVIWTLMSFSSSFEAAIIFQSSNKLRRIILRRFWTRRRSNTET